MRTKTLVSNKIIVYVSILSLSFCVIANLSCKKTKPVDEKNPVTVVNEDVDKKETMSCLEIEDNPELSKENQLAYIYSSINGNDEHTLKKNCYSFYSEYWKQDLKRTALENIEKSDSRYDTVELIKNIIREPEIDVTIKSIQGNIAIISRSFCGDIFDGLGKVEDIWVYSSDKWELLRGYENNLGREVRLLHLNDDQYLDAVITGGCCDSSELHIFIGNKDKVLILRQIIGITGIGGLEYNGKCDSKFDIKPYDAMVERYNSKPKLAKFDCNINGYVITENK